MKKIFINIILIFTILSICVCIIIEKYEENNINSYTAEKLSTENETTNEQEKEEQKEENKIVIVQEKQYPKEEIVDTYKGYNVCAKLEIPTISLETNILSEYSTKALNVSVTKFWGAEPNHTGNFCVAGHNFKNKNMFSNLKKLKIGDKLFVSDKEIGKVEYEIFKIDTVLPEDVSCLDAVTENQKEVTLITCTSDSKKRIIIKAKEI